jgi:hypothetical protein
VEKSVVLSAVPVVLFVVPITALMWVCQIIPRQTAVSKLALPRAAIAEAAEFECDEWEDQFPDFNPEWRDDAAREAACSALGL